MEQSTRALINERLRAARNNSEKRQAKPKRMAIAGSSRAAKDARRELRKKNALLEIQKRRFFKVSCIGELVGRTRPTAPQGAGQAVFFYADRIDNVALHRHKADGTFVFVKDAEVKFKSTFARDDARKLALARYEQAMALTRAEMTGVLSTADAVMAARHRGAWNMALRVAADAHLYNKIEEVPECKAMAEEAQAVYDRYNSAYFETEENAQELESIKPEVVAHACGFAHAYIYDFPQFFRENPDDYLDYFVAWYSTQVYATRHNDPVLDGTIDFVQPTAILEGLTYEDASAERTSFDAKIITMENLDVVCYLNVIAMEDAGPDVTKVDENDTIAVIKELNIATSDETKWGFATQPSAMVPEDLSHLDEWFSFFFDGRDTTIELPHNRYPRVAMSNRNTVLSKKALQKLKEYEFDFVQWSDDVVARLVWEEVRRQAMKDDLAEMEHLHTSAEWMMDEKPLAELLQTLAT